MLLQGLPSRLSARDIGTGLLKGKLCFFEPKPFAAQELPNRFVRHLDPAGRQFILQAVQRQMWRLVDALDNECPIRLQNTFAMPTHLAGRNRAGSPVADATSLPRKRQPRSAPLPISSFRRPRWHRPRALEDHWIEVLSSDAGLLPSLHLESQNPQSRDPQRINQEPNRSNRRRSDFTSRRRHCRPV
jgi:hypothetical protein